MLAALVISILLGAAGVYLLFAAFAHCAYPQSRTTVEVYPSGLQPPRRWGQILGHAVPGLVLPVIAGSVFFQIYLPASRLVEVERVVHETFKTRLQREPSRVALEPDGHTERGRWAYKGTAWLGENEVWAVEVAWDTAGWECRAHRLQ